jgi:hypothetical protein
MTARQTTGKKGRTKKTTTVIEERLPEGDSGLLDDEPTNDFDVALESVQDSESLREALEQFGMTEGVLYRIYKAGMNGPSFCYESGEYSPVILQRERGAGNYTIRIFINGKYKKTISESIEAPALGSGPDPSPNGSHSAFLEKMLMALIVREHAPQQGTTITELTQALANLDGLRGKQESGMDLVLKGVELAKSLMSDSGGGSADWKTELLKMGRDAIPAITSVVQSRVTQSGQPLQPEQVQGTEQPTMFNPQTMTEDQKKTMLYQAVQFLKQQFIAGFPPESALDFLIANRGNPQYQMIITAVLGYTFEQIVELDHDLQSESFNVPFRTLYDGLRSEFGPEDSVEDDTGGSDGDSVDVRSNGATRKTGK